MIPSSVHLFTLFKNHFDLEFNSNSHERENVVNVSANVFRRAFSSNANAVEDRDRDVAATVRENYEELGECCAALQRVADALARPAAAAPCAAACCAPLLRALQACYAAHALQPLKCHHLVTEYKQCARDHALSAQL